jgi:hypothetical protein
MDSTEYDVGVTKHITPKALIGHGDHLLTIRSTLFDDYFFLLACYFKNSGKTTQFKKKLVN